MNTEPDHLRRSLLLGALLGLAGCGTAQQQRQRSAETTSYVFTHFVGNGQDGLHLAVSDDGYRWARANQGRSVMAPALGKEKLVRDPCIVQGPDGVYHMVWTIGWNGGGIGYACSKDLLNWSEQRELPVMAHEPGALNAWAPEIAYDSRRGEYLIVWASTIPGRFPETDGTSEQRYNHRMYATTTRDFNTFTPTRLFYDPGFSVIDATFLDFNGKQYLIVKDETLTPPRKHLRLAEAASLQGPFGALQPPLSRPGLWAEGPSALQIGDYAVVYMDAYRDGFYTAMRSRDLVNWEDISSLLHFPDEHTKARMRHGTVIAIPRALARQLA